MLGGKDIDLPQYRNAHISYILSLKVFCNALQNCIKKINGFQKNRHKHVMGEHMLFGG